MYRKIFSIIQKIVEIKNSPQHIAEHISIYVFHHVTDDVAVWRSHVGISTEAFVSFIQKKKEKYVFCKLDDVNNEISFRDNAIVITFDDVCEDAYFYAIPILRRYQIPYTVFVAPFLIGKPGYITEEELDNLKSDPLCTVGAHSMSHDILRKLNLETKAKEINLFAHEEILKCPIKYFAYPYGSYYACDRRSRALVEKEYMYGFSTLNFPLTRKYLDKHAAFLPRINVNYKNYLKV